MSGNQQKKSIKDWPEDERPREKAYKHGFATLSKAELLAILVGSGTVEESAVELMRKVLASCGDSISALSRLSIDDLCMFKGIGPAKATTIMAACELWKRRSSDDIDTSKSILSSKDLHGYFYSFMCNLPVEECHMLLLNNRNKVIDHVKIAVGGLTATVVDIRLILREALLKRATGIALCHNHPSGSLKPSGEDDRLTKSLYDASKIMNIKLVDHIIITDNGYYSYSDSDRL